MKQKTIRLLAADLDGTLFSNFSKLSKRTASTLKALKENGVIVVVSSGRPLYSILRSVPEELFDYASCMNGQEIYCPKDKSHIIKPDLSKSEMRELLNIMSHHRVILAYSDEDHFYHYAAGNHAVFVTLYQFAYALIHKIRHETYYPQKVYTNLSQLTFEHVGKFCFAGTYHALKAFLNNVDQNRYSCFFVNHHWLEVQPYGISKGQALKEIMEKEHVSKDEACALGDGENDVPMFECVGTKVAMNNAMKSVKRKANAFAGNYYEDGAAIWIEKNIL